MVQSSPKIESLGAQNSESAIAELTPRQIAWSRLKQNKVAMVSGAIAIIAMILAYGAPLFTGLLGLNPNSTYQNLLDSAGLPQSGFNGMSFSHPFGLEPGSGRDLFALMLYGSRISFSVAIITSVSFVLVGMILGIVAALYGGRTDNILGRIADYLLSFPFLFFAIALSSSITLSIQKMGIAQGNGARIIMLIGLLLIFSWSGFFRIIRSQVLTLREKEFILAARSLGASNRRIIFKEIMPNLIPIAVVYLTISLPGYLSTEATLSFLGVGIQAPASTWGLTLDDATNYWQKDPVYLLIPAGLIIIVVLALNLFGDGLRDALDSRSNI